MAVLFDNENLSAGAISPDASFGGGQRMLNLRADDYGSGEIVLQISIKNDGTSDRWDDVANGTFTADAQVRLNYTSASQTFRAQLVGGTGATNVFLEIVQ